MDFVTVKDTKIPLIGFGTHDNKPIENCVQAVQDALAMGYRHIDTAQNYGNEGEIGTAIQTSSVPRDDIFLTTKVGWQQIDANRISPSVDESLQKLQTDYVDLLLLHAPGEHDFSVEHALSELQLLQEAGKTKYIGVSNFPVGLMHKVVQSGIDILTTQMEYHPFIDQTSVLDMCQQQGWLLTAYCPLGRGKALDDPTICDIAKKHQKSPAQIALRWLIQQKGVITIPKAGNPEHARQNLDVFDFELEQDDIDLLNALPKDHRVINLPWVTWDPAPACVGGA